MEDQPVYDKHIFICTNQRAAGASRKSCGEAHGLALIDAFRAAIRIANLPVRIRAQKAGCLDFCDHGPTVAIYPEGTFYVNVQPGDVQEIVDEHIINNNKVNRLLFQR